MITCTLWKSTGRMRRYLHVCVTGEDSKWIKDCQGTDTHRALVLLDEMAEVRDERGCFPYWEPESVLPNAWPKTCEACGVLFENFEVRSDAKWRVYRHIMPRLLMTDGSRILTISEVPVGAMWFADPPDGKGSQFWHDRGGGPHLIVRTPGGDWNLDRPSSGGPGWQRSGEPPQVTATPSCHCDPPSGWHGYLTNGILVPA